MRPSDRSDLWWRTAVIYCLDVEKFQDSDGDGVGDFRGLSDRVEYLAALGVNCIWLMPFQPTADRDDGYDITDYYGVDPRLGDLGTFLEFLRVAHDRGIRVIIDLVVNHTSDRHPWFLSAKRSRSSKFRDYYIWRDHPPKDQGPTVFPGEEDSVWERESPSGQYYLHSFYRHQPDLNLGNPAVRSEIARVIGFWLQLGVDGFRLDAVPFLIEPPGAADESDPHAFLRELRRFVGRRSGDSLLLGEVGLEHDAQLEYFGSVGPELDLQLDFVTAEALFLALVRRDGRSLERVIRGRPRVDASQGWATFLRNHDELSLELLSEDERAEVFDALAPREDKRVYGRGIVRRLAPMLEGDPRRLRLAYSLLFSLPGAPVIYYGEEIGMGELPEGSDRNAVRTPMQWEAGRNGGFSTARPSRLAAPIPEGGYGPEHVNVLDQQRDPESLLQFVTRLVSRYRAAPEIAWGESAVLETDEDQVLVHAAATDDTVFIAVHNFSDEPCSVEVPLAEICGDRELIDLLTIRDVERPDDGRLHVALEGYGFRWFRAKRREAAARA